MRLSLSKLATIGLLAAAATACGSKASKHDDAAGNHTNHTVGYPDLAGFDSLAFEPTADAAKADCVQGDWRQLLLPKGIDIHSGDDLRSHQLYVELVAQGCQGLIPLAFDDVGNSVSFQFGRAIFKTACTVTGRDADPVTFNYLQMTENGKRAFAFALHDPSVQCAADANKQLLFSE